MLWFKFGEKRFLNITDQSEVAISDEYTDESEADEHHDPQSDGKTILSKTTPEEETEQSM
jgi:hypothetical protein